jgi:hypothetical protein
MPLLRGLEYDFTFARAEDKYAGVSELSDVEDRVGASSSAVI